MPGLSNLELVIAVAALAVPAVLIPAVPRRWLGRAILLWAAAPVILYAAALAWEAATRPGGGYGIENAFHGFMLISPLLAPTWAVVCLTGLGIGLLLRMILRRRAPAVPRPVPRRAPPQPPPLETLGWRSEHVGFERDGFRLAGRDVWAEPWRPTGEPPVHLPHPAHPRQIHRYDIHEIGGPGQPLRFAAGELSNGVWGFYLPTSHPEMARGSTPDGGLRYEYSLGEFVNGRYDCGEAWAVLIDGATNEVLVDGSEWTRSRITSQPDGSLHLHLSLNGHDALFRIDPATRSFRDLGAGGPGRPLIELAMAVADARQPALPPNPDPLELRLSPDGTIRVELDPREWGPTLWVYSPRVIDVPAGRVVLDLWRSDWDATVAFPGPRRVRLAFRRFRGGGGIILEIDLAAGTWRVDGEAEQPIATLTRGLEPAWQRAVARGGWAAVPKPPPIRPHPFAAWRTALAILAGATAFIGLVAFLAIRSEATRKPPVLDTVPRFEPPALRR